MGTILKDLAYGARMLRRSPGFTAAAVLTLALGIGANSAIVSVLHGVLLKPLPYADPHRLVLIWENNLQKGWDEFSVSPANFADWRDRARSFAGMAAFRGFSFTLTGGVEPEMLEGAVVSTNLLDLVGVQPPLGRAFRPEEDQPGNHRVVVLGHGLWQRRFGSDPGIVGKSLTLNGEPFTVVGVAPPAFKLLRADLWAPIAFTPEELGRRGSHYNIVLARLAPGVTLPEAQAEMDALASSLQTRYPDTNAGWGAEVVELHEAAVGDSRPALLMLAAAVAFVLLVACANVANLLLARAIERRKEIAIRTALGAGRGRLLRQLLTESLLLAVLGGAGGVLLGAWGVDLLVAVSPDTLPRLREVGMNGQVLAFTLGVSLLTGLLFGIFPALQMSRRDLHESLKEGGRTVSGGAGRQLARSLLVVSEVALALMLLIGAGLVMKSFHRVLSVPPGFQPDRLLTAAIDLPRARYRERDQQGEFFRAALERLEAIPGVESATAVTEPPIAGGDLIYSFEVERRPAARPGEGTSANYYAVGAEYFRTMGIPLRRGRTFTEADDAGAQPVVVIDETMARRFFPGEDPIGKRLRIGNRQDTWREIVGIVGAVNHYALEGGATAAMYEPFLQRPWPSMHLVVRALSDPGGLAPAVKTAVRSVDKDQPIAAVRTMERAIADSVAPRRLQVLLLGIFAGVALALATVGLYGVISYSARQRAHEFGIRMALGASGGDVVRLVVRQGARLALAGAAMGMAGALAATRLISGLLFGVSATDPSTFGWLSLLLVAVAIGASYVPARRAIRVDPMTALRCE